MCDEMFAIHIHLAVSSSGCPGNNVSLREVQKRLLRIFLQPLLSSSDSIFDKSCAQFRPLVYNMFFSRPTWKLHRRNLLILARCAITCRKLSHLAEKTVCISTWKLHRRNLLKLKSVNEEIASFKDDWARKVIGIQTVFSTNFVSLTVLFCRL